MRVPARWSLPWRPRCFRFDDIAENLGISGNLLTHRLEALVTDGIVERQAYQERPLRHEYHLTEAGRELVPVLMALMAWGDKWVTPPGGPPVQLVHDKCGKLALRSDVAANEQDVEP